MENKETVFDIEKVGTQGKPFQGLAAAYGGGESHAVLESMWFPDELIEYYRELHPEWFEWTGKVNQDRRTSNGKCD